jgi:hypothetical protein
MAPQQRSPAAWSRLLITLRKVLGPMLKRFGDPQSK